MISACIVVGSAFIANLIFRNKHPWISYILAFILVLLSSIFFGLGAYEFKFTPVEMKLSKDDRVTYRELRDYHLDNAQNCEAQARLCCTFLPDVPDRDKATYCFEILVSTLLPTQPMSKIMAACATFLIKYGFECMQEWHKIQKYLHEAKYHYEMYEFYQDVLDKA